MILRILIQYLTSLKLKYSIMKDEFGQDERCIECGIPFLATNYHEQYHGMCSECHEFHLQQEAQDEHNYERELEECSGECIANGLPECICND